MAAPDGIVWGSTSNSYIKLGIYVGLSSTATQTTATVEVWFASKYGIRDSANVFYTEVSTDAYASITGRPSDYHGSVSVATWTSTGSGWSTSNHQKLWTGTYTYNKGTSAQTIKAAAYLGNIYNHDSQSAVICANTSFTVPALASYTVAYNANGGSGAPSPQTKYYGTSLKLSSTKPTRSGYTFNSWNTKSDGSGTSYSSGATYSANAALTLYAQWTVNTCTITYNANGGNGAPSKLTEDYGTTVSLSTTTPTRVGYNFLGWSKSSTATTASYKAGASYKLTASVTLYAVWQYVYEKPTISNITVSRCKPLETTPTSFNDFVLSDEGTWIVIKYDCTTYLTTTANEAEWASLGGTFYPLANISGTNIWYTSADSLLAGGLTEIDLENTYQVRITVSDTLDTSTFNYDVYGYKLAIDIRPDKITYAHIESTNDLAGDVSNHIYYNTSSFIHTSGKTYTLSFLARSSVAGTVLASCTAGSIDNNYETYTLSTDWQMFVREYTTTVGGSLTLWMVAANTDADITNIVLSENGGDNVLIDPYFVTSADNWISVGSHTITAAVDTGGLGVAIGKTAEHSGVFDIGLAAKFTKGIQNEVLTSSDGVGVDLNSILIPNTYVSINNAVSTYLNPPPGFSGTFTLEVLGGGAEGQLMQRATATGKGVHRVCVRHYYQKTWGDWVRTFGVQLYNNTSGSTGTITLSETSANFKYLEIFFTDNNNISGGYTKVYSPNGKTIGLSLVESSNNSSTHIRRTEYTISGTSITPDTSTAGYLHITSSFSHTTGTNYIKIVRVVGYEIE